MMRKTISCFIFLICLTGCEGMYLPTTPTRDFQAPTHRTTLLPPENQYSTFTTEPTLTETPSPTLTSTPSPTNTPEPSLTPLPTVISYHSLMNYVSFTGNPECRLPCWAGITPGITTWEDAVNLINPISNFVDLSIDENIDVPSDGIKNYLSYFYFSKSEYETVRFDGDMAAHLVNEEMVIEKIYLHYSNSTRPQEGNIPSIGLPLPENLSLKNVLIEHGITDLVFLGTDLGVPEFPKVALFLDFVYPDDQFIISFSRWAYVRGEYLISCEPDTIVSVRIINNKDDLESKDAIEKANLPRPKWFYLGDAYQDVTNIPVDVFFYDYINSDSNCLTFPIDAWKFMIIED